MSTAPSFPARETAESTAVKLLEFGLWAIPLYPAGVTRKSGQVTKGKEPYGTAWGAVKNTPGSLREVYGRMPDAGVGICLGPDRSPDDDWMIDLEGDGPNAKDSLARLFDGEIVDTIGWDSYRGSHSLFIASPEFLELIKSAGASEGTGLKAGVWHLDEFPDLEFRIGGYKPDGSVKQVQSACPPTVGEDGNPRRWHTGKVLASIPHAAARNLEKIAERKAAQVRTVKPDRSSVIPMAPTLNRVGSYGQSAIQGELDAVASATEGNRNNTLNSAAFKLGTLAGAGVIDASEVEGRLIQAAVASGLSEGEARQSARSGLSAGRANPRILPESVVNPPARREAADVIRIDATAEISEADAENIEVVDRWPNADAAIYHGLAGEFVQRIAPETEADPVATLFQVLAGFGNLIGRGPHFVVGSTKHFCVLNVAVVGATAVGRKGTSGDDAEFLLGNVDPHWLASRCKSGLASGEGLIHAVRDPKYRKPSRDEIKKGHPHDELVLEDEGVGDKRLHVVETEMGKLLKVMSRDSNTLSDTIRLAWDGKPLGNMSKTAGCTATNAHITIVGHVTKADIAKCLTETDMSNGFANRFLWVAARRSKMLPDGGNMFDLNLSDLHQRARRAREFAMSLGEHRMTFDAEFRHTWRAIYQELSSDQRHVVAGRSEAYVKRLACIYALLDETAVVNAQHLYAALACWDYVHKTIEFVFGPASRDPNEAKLLNALKGSPDGMTRTQISSEVFKRNIKKETLATALGNLLTQGAIHSKVDASGPKPVDRWFAGRAS